MRRGGGLEDGRADQETEGVLSHLHRPPGARITDYYALSRQRCHILLGHLQPHDLLLPLLQVTGRWAEGMSLAEEVHSLVRRHFSLPVMELTEIQVWPGMALKVKMLIEGT